MGSVSQLPLSDIVNVTVLVQPVAPVVPTFNVGLIFGPTAVIPAAQRVRTYTGLTAMLSDGFLVSSPEYLAASEYFGQAIPPQSLIVGRQDLTSIATFAMGSGASGTSYVVGDIITIVQGPAAGGTLKVLAVNGSGAITSASLNTPGTGYSVASGLVVTGGAGSGATVNILTIGDTPLLALIACRSASPIWWGAYSTAAITADHQAIAAYVQTLVGTTMYFYNTADVNVPTGGAGNIFAFMKAASYNRVYGVYSTTQGGAFPNNIYSGAAALGTAMGLNTGLANSFFTMFGKVEVGIATEPLSETQVGVIAGNNGNMYLNFGGVYTLMTSGKVGNGQFMDEVLNLDMLTAGIQFNVMNQLTQNPAIPQTDAGQTQLIHAVNQAAQASQLRGFIATGKWTGVQIISLAPGDSVPGGYLAQSYPYSTQLQSDRQARKAMPIYLAIIESGAAQSLLVGVYVQR